MSDHQDWIDELYAEGDREAPPAALDRAILAAAREPFRRPWYRQQNTLASLAMAASVVLAAMIVYYAPISGIAPPTGEAKPPPTAAAARAESQKVVGQLAEPEVQTRAEGPPARQAAKRVEPGRDRMEFAVGVAAGVEEIVVSADSTDTVAGNVGLAAAAPASPATEAHITPEQVLTMLETRCGPAPGRTGSRRLVAEGRDWHLEVRSSSGVRYWRCARGEWTGVPEP